jgi:hypothetical protein
MTLASNLKTWHAQGLLIPFLEGKINVCNNGLKYNVNDCSLTLSAPIEEYTFVTCEKVWTWIQFYQCRNHLFGYKSDSNIWYRVIGFSATNEKVMIRNTWYTLNELAESFIHCEDVNCSKILPCYE